jgi:hypothetical protein
MDFIVVADSPCFFVSLIDSLQRWLKPENGRHWNHTSRL